MIRSTRLSAAIFSALAAMVGSPPADAVIEEVLVTATKRTEYAQDTAVTVQAISAESISDLGIDNFDDYVRYIPNITAGGRGPGQSEVYIRGMSIDAVTVLLSGAQGTTPNVAMYLDEQPITAPGRNLDVFVTDIERIEVLPGPQGTLYGASSQAGTVRLITRKPVVDEFDAGITVGLASTKDGDMSNSVEGFINLPLVDEKFAVRAVVYESNKGGYIDNVPGTFTPDPAINPTLPADALYTSADNSQFVESDFNEASYKGIRLGGKYYVNDDWELLVQYSHQKLETDGVFDYDPAIGDLMVARYFKDELNDSFDQTAWTLEGRLAALELLYTGAYLDRDIQQFVDYTGYNNVGGFIGYYTCTYTNPDYIINYGIDPALITDVRECGNPVKGFAGLQTITRQTHEFRLSTPAENHVRAVAGVFYDDVEIKTQDDYVYLAAPDLGFAPNAPISSAISINPNTRPSGVTFFNDVTRTEEQLAFFGELSVDLSDSFTLTAGLRWYDLEVDFAGSSNFADGIFQGSVNTDRGRDYDRSLGHSTEPLTESDTIPKLSLSYQPTDDVLLYGTYSEGFRPGGWNRGGGAMSFNSEFPIVPVNYGSDDVKSYEFGWKTTLAGGNVQFNGAAYFIDWTDMQVSRFDPINVSILTFIDNAADSEIRGVESDIIWAATDKLTLFGALAYIDTELVSTKSAVIELAPVGSELSLTPNLRGSIRARYEWGASNYQLHWQVGIQHAGSSFSSIVAADRRNQDSYTTVDIAFGVDKGAWSAELFIENLGDERAQLFFNVQDDVPRITTNRPRTMGLRLSYDF